MAGEAPRQAGIMISPRAVADIASIVRLFEANRHDPALFQLPESEITRSIEAFLVARDLQGSVVGCAAMYWYTRRLAEVGAPSCAAI
jgi:N-acetylglutamate synthase-like GNAT family acetyltransferase